MDEKRWGLGIDPGKKGAVVLVDENNVIQGFWLTPCDDGVYDIKAMNRCVRVAIEQAHMVSAQVVCYIEAQSAAPPFRKGADGKKVMVPSPSVSILTTGRGWGMWETVVSLQNLSYDNVPPQRWQGEAGIDRSVSDDPKVRARHRFNQLFPCVALRKTHANGKIALLSKEDMKGVVDAALLAVTARDCQGRGKVGRTVNQGPKKTRKSKEKTNGQSK